MFRRHNIHFWKTTCDYKTFVSKDRLLFQIKPNPTLLYFLELLDKPHF